MRSRELIIHCSFIDGDCSCCEYVPYCDAYMEIYVETPYLEEDSVAWDENIEL